MGLRTTGPKFQVFTRKTCRQSEHMSLRTRSIVSLSRKKELEADLRIRIFRNLMDFDPSIIMSNCALDCGAQL